MVGPVEVVIEVDAEVSKGLDGRNVVGVACREGVSGSLDWWADELGVCVFACERHEFGFGGVSLEAVFVEPGEDGFIFGSC